MREGGLTVNSAEMVAGGGRTGRRVKEVEQGKADPNPFTAHPPTAPTLSLVTCSNVDIDSDPAASRIVSLHRGFDCLSVCVLNHITLCVGMFQVFCELGHTRML